MAARSTPLADWELGDRSVVTVGGGCGRAIGSPAVWKKPRASAPALRQTLAVEVRPLDPRDVQWEEEAPVFRLTFWRRQHGPSGLPPEHLGYEARELEISGAEVGEVLSWARDQAQVDETWTLYVLLTCPDLGLGQVLLSGADPTADHHTSGE